MYMARRVSRVRRRAVPSDWGRFAYNHLLQWRELSGLTQAELGRRVGKTYATIGRYETGEIALTLDVVEDLSLAMGITVVQFIQGPQK
jgi:transcriptional regulator with XRE-family HTH domain